MTQEEINENLRFKERCVLNLEGVDIDAPIYRVFPIARLIQLFTERKNTLVKPRLWDDPFENFIFRQKAILKNGQDVHFDNIRERYYGQCWTLNTQETDALWRIYSHDKDGVRVKTTLRKLFDGFYDPNYKFAMIAYFLGKIIYDTTQEIQDFFEDPENLEMIFDTTGAGSVRTLLVKRMEFQHENEVRLVFAADRETYDLNSDIYQYSIDPNDLFDELLFEPRFDDALYTAKTTELRDFGFTKTIAKSKLYQIPNFNLRLNH